nr:nudix hydrolase 1-like [Ipomoea batatas]
MSSDKVPKVAVAVFILKGEKVLVGKRLAGAGTSCFSVPSGHLEFDRCEGWDWYEWNDMPKPLTPPLQLILNSGFNPFSAGVQN